MDRLEYDNIFDDKICDLLSEMTKGNFSSVNAFFVEL